MLPGRSGGDGERGGRKANASQLAANARAERAKRKADKEAAQERDVKLRAAAVIVRCIRRYIGLQALRRELRPRWDAELAAMAEGGKPAATALFGLCGRLLLFCDPSPAGDAERLSALCKRLVGGSPVDHCRLLRHCCQHGST